MFALNHFVVFSSTWCDYNKNLLSIKKKNLLEYVVNRRNKKGLNKSMLNFQNKSKKNVLTWLFLIQD